MTKAIILDTETSGLPPTGEACEIAYFPLLPMELWETKLKAMRKNIETKYLWGNADLLSYYHQTFMPKGEFSPRASEVNGFTKENLKGSPCISTFKFPADVTYMIGHNIMFDWQMVTKPDVKLICTKELSIKYLTKQSGKGTKGVNTLTGLIERYYPEEAKELIAKAHSALQDCKLCYLILLKVLEAAPELDSFEKLAEQCSQPAGTKHGVKLPPSIKQDPYTKEYMLTFGKYKGLAFSRIDKVELHKYLTWIVEVSSLSLDLKDFVKQFLKANK